MNVNDIRQPLGSEGAPPVDMNTMQNNQQEIIPIAKPIGKEQLQRFTQELQRYKAGKANLEARVVASENWWKLRNAAEEGRESATWDGFKSQSAWLHNVIASKHADAMDSYPSPTILPRESEDRSEAKILSDILPCILEQNHFDDTYNDVMWQKLKSGTGCYKVMWDSSRMGGLGDIAIERANLLNVFWEPGVTDIQKSKYFFDTELVDNEILEYKYPELQGKLKGNAFVTTKFLYDDTVSTDGKTTVIGAYYHKGDVLHYCKYVGETVLESTENDPQYAERGLYDHGKYPFVFDPLFPIEGSPCGYGYVDLCRNPQTVIDKLDTAILRNAMAGATPRYFMRADGAINEEEFLDLTKSLVHVNGGGLGEDSLRRVDHNGLDTNYLHLLTQKVQELRETSGNTETATGSSTAGVTAASAIAALQEASGKTSRDATRSAYRSFTRIVELCIELIRQFYDVPRQFRIVGQRGMERFVSYSNAGIAPQAQGSAFGVDLGYRVPAFDIKIEAQRKNAYSTMAQNELAMQFFQLGFFNPQLTDQAIACMDLMEFEGKDAVVQKIAQNGQIYEMLMMVEQYAVNLAAKYGDQQALMQLQGIIQKTGAPMGAEGGGLSEAAKMPKGEVQEEASHVRKAREQSANASQPGANAASTKERSK